MRVEHKSFDELINLRFKYCFMQNLSEIFHDGVDWSSFNFTAAKPLYVLMNQLFNFFFKFSVPVFLVRGGQPQQAQPAEGQARCARSHSQQTGTRSRLGEKLRFVQTS